MIQMVDSLKKIGFYLLLCLTGIVYSSCGQEDPAPIVNEPMTEEPEDPMDITPEENTNAIKGDIRDISSMELVAEMGIGWNLGNSFDVRAKDKTVWGNPLTTSTHIRDVKEMGFETLRIPITWDYDQLSSSPYTIETPYLARIALVVNEALNNDMHVIINTHHDDWIVPTNTEATRVKNRLSSLWTQVANYFKDYGDKLIFETMNEARLHGSPEEWSGGTQEGRDKINEYHQVAVDAIRATGGNNNKRHIMVSTYAASSNGNAMRDLVVPNNDPNVIISIHSYFPWSFAGQEDGTNIWGSDEEKGALDAELDRIRDRWMVQEGRAVILGEWGTTDKNNNTARAEYCAYYAQAATERGLLPIIWDDGGNFGLYDRHAGNWKYEAIAQAVVAAAN